MFYRFQLKKNPTCNKFNTFKYDFELHLMVKVKFGANKLLLFPYMETLIFDPKWLHSSCWFIECVYVCIPGELLIVGRALRHSTTSCTRVRRPEIHTHTLHVQIHTASSTACHCQSIWCQTSMSSMKHWHTYNGLTLLLSLAAFVQGVFCRVVSDCELVQQGDDHLNTQEGNTEKLLTVDYTINTRTILINSKNRF